MKQFKFVFALILLLSITLSFPIQTHAVISPSDSLSAAYPNYTKDDITQIAISAFPELAAKLMSTPTSDEIFVAMSDTDPDITTVETRSVSENQEITYFEYSTGTYGLLFNDYHSITNSSNSGSAAVRTAHFWVTYALSSDVSHIYDFTYQLVNGTYDSIISTGYTYAPTLSPLLCSYSLSESSSSDAYAEYLCYFPSTLSSPDGESTQVITIYLGILVGDDSMSTYLN